MTSLNEKKYTFTKIIVIWAMVVTSIYLIMSEIGVYVLNTEPSESITDLVQMLIVGVIIGYMGKSGYEFYQRNKTTIAQVNNTLNTNDSSSNTNYNNENV